jgi:hypothetical protein
MLGPELVMRSRIALAALVVLGLAAPGLAKKPLPCPAPPRALFVSPGTSLVTGATTPSDALLLGGTRISIGSTCPPVSATLKAKKGFTAVTAKWKACGSAKKVMLKAQLAPPCSLLSGTLKTKSPKGTSSFQAKLSACGDGVVDPGNAEECDGSPCQSGRACLDDCTCETTSTTTTSTVTTTTATSTTLPCCGAERITLTSGPGTLQLADFDPFPFPAGIVTTLDSSAPVVGRPECRHAVVIPPDGFQVPNFDVPALRYCSLVQNLHCESGNGEGAGALWDGSGDPGLALTNVTKVGDTLDGTCNPAGQVCGFGVGQAGTNTLGDIDVTRTASASRGVRSAVDIRLHSITWRDANCDPFMTPGCCASAQFGDDALDQAVTEFDFILTPTTDVATGAFVDKNGDGCSRAGRGFDGPHDGPKTLTGTPAAGPCCTVGQATTIVSVGIAFSGMTPLFDLGFSVTTPNTVTACGVPGTATCTVTTDPCMQ